MLIDRESIIYPLPQDELFVRKEGFWRVKLPLDYILFLKENNGARLNDGGIKCNDREYVIDRFLCLLSNPGEITLGMYDIDVTLTQIEDRLTDNEELIGVDLLPVAVLFAGDFICLDFRETRHNPTVCLWSNEESSELNPMTYYLANSFSGFLEQIN